MHIRLNLATKPLENQRRFLLGATLAGGAALALFAFLTLETYRTLRANREMREETSRLQNELRDFRAQRRELEDFFKQPETRRVMDRASFLNGLIEQRSFPWTKIFMDLEQRLPAGVRVVSIAPKRKDEQIELKLVVGATSDESKVKFLKTLEEAPEFAAVQVTSESRGKAGTGHAEDQVVVELLALYQRSLEPAKPAAPAKAAGPRATAFGGSE
jgi:Tfp pilus assembly protein PilN